MILSNSNSLKIRLECKSPNKHKSIDVCLFSPSVKSDVCHKSIDVCLFSPSVKSDVCLSKSNESPDVCLSKSNESHTKIIRSCIEDFVQINEIYYNL